MVKDCCVKSCKESWTPNTHLSFFAFPFNNEEMKEKWLKASPGYKSLSKHSAICSNHFTPDDYNEFAGRRLLKKNAVPSVFGPRCPNGCVQIPDSHAGIVNNQGCNSSSEMNIMKPQMITFFRFGDQGNGVTQICASHLPGLRSNEITTKKFASVSVQTCPRLSGPSEREKELQNKIRILQGRLRRREGMLKNAKQLVAQYKKSGKTSDNPENKFLRKFTEFDLELFKNEANNNNVGKNSKTYTQEMKDFAATLYSYSPRAYKFVRSKINLPHTATLRRWIAEARAESAKKEGAGNSVVECNEMEEVELTRIDQEKSTDNEMEEESADIEAVKSIQLDKENAIEIERLEFSGTEEAESVEIEEVDSTDDEIEELESTETEEMESIEITKVETFPEITDAEFIEIEEAESVHIEKVNFNDTEKRLVDSRPEIEEAEFIEIEEAESVHIEKVNFNDTEKRLLNSGPEIEEAEFTEIEKIESIRMERVKSNESEKRLVNSRPTVLITFPLRGGKTQPFHGTLKRYVMKTTPKSSTKACSSSAR